MKIFCCQCQKEIEARFANGEEIYPHREDLYKLPFWKCDFCGNYVGCHYKSRNPTKPLGCIPNAEIKLLRRKIHAIIDKFNRHIVYAFISHRIGYNFHCGELRNKEEYKKVIKILNTFKPIKPTRKL
ncbi:MAG: hypothetical protein KAJ48_10055 [Elusimicrobiales bacterium]|nr:hypothetical protein [Elusimicrobiales bacterium]